MKFEHKNLLFILLSGVFSFIIAGILLWCSGIAPVNKICITTVMLLFWAVPAYCIQSRINYSLRTMSNLLGSLREGDYSFRLKGASHNDSMGELVWEVNALTEMLQENRLTAEESSSLLRKVLAEIDIVLLGFDEKGYISLINESGEKLFDLKQSNYAKYNAQQLGLSQCLTGPARQVLDLTLPSGSGRWEIRRATYREKGLPHQLLVLTNLTRVLHDQERTAWKQLVQILRHEINNSLTPIQSVAQSLQSCLNDGIEDKDNLADLKDGLDIISTRAGILARFIDSYSKMTHLPVPKYESINISEWINHAASLEQRVKVKVISGPESEVAADRSQLDQLLINIIANAVEASKDSPSADGDIVQVSWQVSDTELTVWVDDSGQGINTEKDPFIPFYTTKTEGSGIGLSLGRQIAEAHDGSLELIPSPLMSGCRAELKLPLTHNL